MELRSAVVRPGRSLFVTVCLINAAMFAAAAGVLVVSPATVSAEVTAAEASVLVLGVVAVVTMNTLVLRGRLLGLDRLARQLDDSDVSDLSWRLPVVHRSGVERSVATAFNALLDRLAAERLASESKARAAEEAERRRVARELHDEVGQRLTVVLLSVGRLSSHVSAWQREELTLVQENTRESLELVRGLADGLRGGTWEDMDLLGALSSLAETFRASSGLRVLRRLDPTLPPVAPEAEQTLFRVAQEAMTNVARHAGADTVELELGRSEEEGQDCLVLTVTDDGRGYRPGSAGFGIAGMRERARAVGGTLDVRRRESGGTRVRLVVPTAAPRAGDLGGRPRPSGRAS